MKAGDLVKLVGIPPDLKNDSELQTRTLFENCLGRSFVVVEIETIDGLPHQLAKLNVGHALGERSETHAIWVEDKYLQIENSD